MCVWWDGAIGVEGGSCVTQQVLSGGGDDPSDNLATSGHLAILPAATMELHSTKTHTDRPTVLFSSGANYGIHHGRHRAQFKQISLRGQLATHGGTEPFDREDNLAI